MNPQKKYNIEFIDKTKTEQLQEYDDFVNTHQKGTFFQCSAWAKVKHNWHNELIILRKQSGEICGSALVLIKKLLFLPIAMLYVPRGPVCDYNDETVLDDLLKGIKIVARRHHACMLRIDPCVDKNDNRLISLLKSRGFILTENPDDYSITQMCNHYILELKGKSEEEVFEAFHPKWRYNIRLAVRKGVTCTVCSLEELNDFYRLMQMTGARDGFEIRSKTYYENMMSTMGEHCRLYMCQYNGTAVAGAIAIQYNGKTSYLYGASGNEHRNVMPNYLMQWEMIKWALQADCTHYDFMGIPYYYDKNHPNYGVYRFKKGFNGDVVSYAGDFDYIYSPILGGLLRRHLTIIHRKR